jgi:hypothetical protein
VSRPLQDSVTLAARNRPAFRIKPAYRSRLDN